MAFTVSCAACNSRFLLGDDLFRRKVSGKVVTVKCRTCNAEISVDATEPPTLPSHEAPAPPRAHPAPPRPKHKEGGATGTPLPHGTATGTPLPKPTATGTPLPRPTATGTPLPKPPIPRGNATATPVPAGALLSIWDAAEKSAPPKKPPPRAQDLELITDFEEAPPSSSDAPTLTELKHEASPPKKPRTEKKAPDDFLVNLSAGTGGIVGAPSINMSGLASPPPPEVEELLEIEATEVVSEPRRKQTAPLFDMSAVLPAATESAKSLSSSLSAAHLDVPIDEDVPVTPSQAARVRKHVVAPVETTTTAPKAKRGSGAVWFLLVAAAAGVVAIVGLRGRAAPAHPTPLPEASSTPQLPAETKPTAEPEPSAATEMASAAPPPAGRTETSSAKPSSAAVPTPTSSSVKTSSTTPAQAAISEPTAPKTAATSSNEKPAEAEKPTAPTPKSAPEPAEPGTEFDRSAAIAALKAAAAEASTCRKDGDPSGTATLTITFAPSGRVTSANIQGPPFAGTPTGGCIANAMRHAHVPAFSGDRVTVNKTIVIQ